MFFSCLVSGRCRSNDIDHPCLGGNQLTANACPPRRGILQNTAREIPGRKNGRLILTWFAKLRFQLSHKNGFEGDSWNTIGSSQRGLFCKICKQRCLGAWTWDLGAWARALMGPGSIGTHGPHSAHWVLLELFGPVGRCPFGPIWGRWVWQLTGRRRAPARHICKHHCLFFRYVNASKHIPVRL